MPSQYLCTRNIIRGEPERAPNTRVTHGEFAVYLCMYVCMYVAIGCPRDHSNVCMTRLYHGKPYKSKVPTG